MSVNMNIEMEADEAMRQLAELGEDISQATTTTLQELVTQLPQQLRQQIFAEKTNRNPSNGLYSSISASISGHKMEFGMKIYGYFQVFGVTGKSVSSLGIPQPYAGATGKAENDVYKFTKTKNRGITPVRSAAKTLGGIGDLIVEALTDRI